jgi:translation initiation factor 2 subunit 1
MSEESAPKIGELVIAQIAKVMQFGAYCRLPEYNNMEVFLPIKEVSSGWIKNIREFIHEGQNIVGKVTIYDKEKKTIDISLKKVTPKETKNKIGEYNLEKRLGALLQQAIKNAGLSSSKESIAKELRIELGTYVNLFKQANSDTDTFENLKIPKRLKDEIKSIIKENIKEKNRNVSYAVTMMTYNTESGASEIRSILSSAEKAGVDISYISAPKYRFIAEGKDYNEAEAKIKKAVEIASSKLKKGVFKYEKEKLKKEKEDIFAQI